MSEKIKNKLTDEELGKVTGGSDSIESDEEFTWTCPFCHWAITTIGYRYMYEICPFCKEKITVDKPEDEFNADLPELLDELRFS